MPELPDVQASKQYLDATALHQKISSLSFSGNDILKKSPQTFRKHLLENSLENSRRVGKNLFVQTGSGMWIAFHFGMTGYLEYYKNQDDPEYAKMIIRFSNSYNLAVVNKRKLGKIDLVEDVDEYLSSHHIGTDATEIKKNQFLKMLEGKSAAVKSALMDQKKMAGIGNIYADEILFQAGIRPQRPVSDLNRSEMISIYGQMQTVLKVAIKRSGRIAQLPDHYLVKHRKEGENCPGCQSKVSKTKISGRSTYYCPSCQN